ncbi:MAG: purine-nucleoside phosphorylase [Spirochaetaceae bacterium]|jgi:purine-nucleoside phosphorylase|nr:purine-nucleoside phosphorylase [Spirochaetaceae bacterium]
MDFFKESVSESVKRAVEYIRGKTALKPHIGLVLGSGLGLLGEEAENAVRIPFAEIPHFPVPTAAGHSGTLIIGTLAGKRAAIMQGRVHYFEGYDTAEVIFPIRVLSALGVESIILTNACGAVSKHFSPGELMAIEDHLSFFCPSPLRGPNLDEFGERFVDMSDTYTPELLALAVNTAKSLGIKLQKGVYGYWRGPTYETAAEIRAFMTLGADVVGMSTVPEAIAARHCGLKILGISCITNMTCIYAVSTSHDEVMAVGKQAAGDFSKLLRAIISKM